MNQDLDQHPDQDKSQDLDQHPDQVSFTDQDSDQEQPLDDSHTNIRLAFFRIRFMDLCLLSIDVESVLCIMPMQFRVTVGT